MQSSGQLSAPPMEMEVLQDSSPSRLNLLVHKLFPTRKWNLYS